MKNRYDFVYLFDVQDGNPNGDPDAGNLPRVDPETGDGLVTDVCLKRKIRNYVGLVKGEQPPHEIYVKEKAILNKQHERAYQALGVDLSKDEKKRKGGDKVDEARAWMCKNFFDVRTFGAVMSTGVNCGQVRGPVQLTFARSVDPVVSLEHCITRVAVTTEEKAKQQEGDIREMGRKFTLPYGLYRGHGFISARLAEGDKGTGFSDDDLALVWCALCGRSDPRQPVGSSMWDGDRSAARGMMAPRKLIVFKHESDLGNAPAHVLFDLVHVERKDTTKPARAFTDYEARVDRTKVPQGVELIEML